MVKKSDNIKEEKKVDVEPEKLEAQNSGPLLTLEERVLKLEKKQNNSQKVFTAFFETMDGAAETLEFLLGKHKSKDKLVLAIAAGLRDVFRKLGR